MADPKVAVHEVRRAIADHFERSADGLELPEVMDMTALDEATVKNALAVLHNKGEIEGMMTWQETYPVTITRYSVP